ncbi:hypothetical protein [Metabacillus rhizolycopersici]|uniref:Uncharacterized protein n=1 Tax=Metabacillus rhizolycopersici TaxID=2875709 RepID=A0ABS7UV76_9BACI|nr:hypothetical protein [Metabacillus rhizolycopersici]MBZ5751855.1 hypothetical protein [Metabacillus rhizolycopersici]
MDLIERVFSEWIQRNYRQHELIQRNEDKKLKNKSVELAKIDRLTEQFEQRMDLNAQEMEQWLIKHMR